MYTSSFYATATGQPDPPFLTPFSPNKLPLEYAPAKELCRVSLRMLHRDGDEDSLHMLHRDEDSLHMLHRDEDSLHMPHRNRDEDSLHILHRNTHQYSSQNSLQILSHESEQSELIEEPEDGCVVISDVENWLSQTIKLKLEGKTSFDWEDRHVMARERDNE